MCDKCNDSGLIPFIREDGAIVKNVYLHCDCHPDYGSNAYETGFLPTLDNRPANTMPLRKRKTPSKAKMRIYADDFDFPMSEDFWKGTYKYYGFPDPTPVTVKVEHEKRPYVPRPIVNVTYNVDGVRNTPAFKDLQEEIGLINGRLTKYFASKKKLASKSSSKVSYKGIK